MKFLITGLLTVLTGASAFSQTALPKSGLTPALQQKLAETALLLDEPDSYCTASPITPDGYMLTALHCLRSCLGEAGASDVASSPNLGLFDIFVSKNSKTGGVSCPNLSIPSLNLKGITVIATGAALTQFDANFMFTFAPYYNELKTAGFASRTNDYAIIKVNPRAPMKCLPLSVKSAAAGTPIWAVGYPLPVDEKVKPTLQASAGRIYANAQESRMYAAAKTENDRTYLTSLYSEAGVLYSNASNQFGQSGGPVITADGTIVGVTSGFTNFGTPEVHELVAVSSASFLRAMPRPLAQDLLRKSAGCR